MGPAYKLISKRIVFRDVRYMNTRYPLFVGSLLLMSMHLNADGFRNPPAGAAAQGRIGGRIAFTPDASAAVHNPANTVEFEQAEVQSGLTFGYSKSEFTDTLGQRSESEDPWAVLPSFFAVYPGGEGGAWVYSGALISPYGRSTRVDEKGPLRYSAPYFTELRSLALSFSAARPVTEQISVAAGVRMVWSQLDLRQIYPWGPATGVPGLPDGKSLFEADGVGLGLTFATTWRISDQHRVAFTVISPVEIEYEGDLSLTQIPQGVPAQSSSDFETEITFPLELALAYGWKVNDRLTLETNIEWVQHSEFEQLKLDAGENTPFLASDEIVTDWTDNWTAGASVAYQMNEEWQLRSGLVWLESPVPSRTMLPTTPEQDQWVWSLGAVWTKGPHILDLSYSLGIFSGRTVTDNENPAFNGEYDFEAHLVSISYGRRF